MLNRYPTHLVFQRDVYKESYEILFCRTAVLDDADREGTQNEGDAGDNHHVALYGTDQTEQYTAYRGCNDLRYTDGAVEESEVCPHVSVAFQRIRDEGERHGKHCRPGAADEDEREEQQVLVVDVGCHGEADAA